jgi:two-component system LytT family response regulator
MLRAVISDDETLARRRIRALLRPHADIEVVQECRDGASTILAINDLHPALLFLDVEMPEIDGFGVLAAAEAVPAVIFVTAHQEYAVSAFGVRALDYILKPFRRSRFEEALERARGRIRELEDLQKLPRSTVDRNILVVRVGGRTVFLQRGEVECIMAERDYVHVIVGDREYLVRESLSALLARLDERFLRVHRSAAVNLENVREVHPLHAGDARLTLQNGWKVTLSRTHRNAFDEWISQHRLRDRLKLPAFKED